MWTVCNNAVQMYSLCLFQARSGRELFVVLFNDFLMMTQSSVRNPIAAIFDSSSTMKYDMYRKVCYFLVASCYSTCHRQILVSAFICG